MKQIIKATRPDEYYLAPEIEELVNRLKQHDMTKGVDLSTTKAAMDAASFQLRGAPVQKSFMDLGLTDNPEMARAIQEAVSAVDFNELTGKTPVQKAVSFTALINSVKGGMPGMMNRSQQGQSIEQQIRELMKNQQAAGGLKSSDNEIAKELLEFDDENPEVSLAKLSNIDKETLTALAAIQKIGAIQSKRVKKLVASPAGLITKPKLMTDYSQLPMLADFSDMIMPDFPARLGNMDLLVKEKFQEEFAKLCALLMIDASGSMCSDWKQGYVRAIMLHYFDLLEKGQASLYIGTFEQQIQGIKKISNATEAKEFFSKYRAGRGGMTDVNGVIEAAQAGFQQGRVGEFKIPFDEIPELIVINDGQDPVEPTKYDRAVHAISLEVENPNLKDVCEQSGGSFNVFYDEHGRNLIL